MIARTVAITLPATLLLLVLTAASLHAASVQLNWTPPTTNADGTALNDLAGYKVYHGSGSRQYTASVDVGNVTSYTLSGLTGGRLYYIAVTASDTSGNESVYSDEIPVTPTDTPPPGAPVANFTANHTVGNAPLPVNFADTSTTPSGSITSWTWNFGVNNATSTLRHPSYTYTPPKLYLSGTRHLYRESHGADQHWCDKHRDQDRFCHRSPLKSCRRL